MKGNYAESSIFSVLSDVEIKEALAKGSIAAMVANKRRKLNMNQKEFAKMLGVSQSMISKWENLEYSFTISSLLELMDKLGVNVEILLDGRAITSSPQNNPLKKFSNNSQSGWTANIPRFTDNNEEGVA